MTLEPMIPGTIRVSKRFTSGVSLGQGSRSPMPARWQAITIHRNWMMPAIAMAQESA